MIPGYVWTSELIFIKEALQIFKGIYSSVSLIATFCCYGYTTHQLIPRVTILTVFINQFAYLFRMEFPPGDGDDVNEETAKTK